ncbi:MAG: type II secretion system F family protein [Rhodocyclaceae bacterium]|nr:type II secretion system F family protein [Rhodocyclaceae bacterium]
MSAYAYTARDSGGTRVEGRLDAPSPDAAAELLLGRGLIPVAINPAQDAAGSLPFGLGDKIPHEEITLFSRQLHALLKAGVPIMRALLGLQESTPHRGMQRVLREVREGLDTGRELSAALARHPKVFTQFYLAMVRVGELTGALDTVFLRLFHHLEFERTLRQQVKAALRYPLFVVLTMLTAIVVVNVFVIPRFASVYQSMNAKLPPLTQLLIAVSDFMLHGWHWLLAAAAALALIVRAWVSTPEGRHAWDRMKLRLPIAGPIVRKGMLARFARSFALALKSGVPIVQAMSVAAQTLENEYMVRKLAGMRTGVERGESVLRSAVASGIFTPVVLQMIAVGEESGALDDLMQEVSDVYQREVEYELSTLASQIEPVLIVVLGVFVLILALGIFLPIWDLGRVALGKG